MTSAPRSSGRIAAASGEDREPDHHARSEEPRRVGTDEVEQAVAGPAHRVGTARQPGGRAKASRSPCAQRASA